ncbi:hypothetical protein [Rhizobium sp. RU36D]|uniref:hypothetical protein n=1 Tax=Rhizobium sp. RU36D TaxID=1907415 RepID=UPI0009D8BB41|nr:hypothetical protein [Rhizobium sp. RU36D]SMD18140.1 hypothetical protein SAMN05880593_13424 [Rhizobium sp. RU36D]
MSLARIALRIAAVEALKGRTLVGENVLDTPNGALDIQADGSLRTGEERPFVAVYTPSGKAEGMTGRSLVENGACEIVFDIGVSSAMLDTNDQGETVIIGINIPASDSSQEFFLDIVQRQICDALTDPENAWADIYRGLHYRVLRIEFAGARSADDAQKLAGHQMRITVELIDDPLKGELPDQASPFMSFLGAMEASGNEEYVKQAAKIRALLAGSPLSWQSVQRRHGMTSDEMRAMGHLPLAVIDDGETPDMQLGTIEVAGLNVIEVGS